MDLIQLERFIEVASAGSMRKAAGRIGVAQPTLTWSIRQLEHSVGAPLFERHGRGSRLTEAGEALLPHAQRLIHDGRRALATIATLQGVAEPQLSVAASPPFTVSILPRAIEAVLGTMPTLRLRVFQSEGPDLLERIRSGEFDVAIGNPRSGGDLKGVDFERVYVEQYLPAARAGHPIFRRRGPITLEALTRYGWAAYRNSLDRLPEDSPFGRAGLPVPVVRTEVSSEHLLRPLILATDLLGYVARDLIAPELASGRIRSIELAPLLVDTHAGLLVREGAIYTPAMRSFCREVRRVCRKLSRSAD